jgi:YHS domain-containing protein
MKTFFALLMMVIVSGCATHATIKDIEGKEVMLAGHDPVAYFKAGGAIRGEADLQATHEGRTYYFASAAHQRAFLLDPAAFEPQYGGYCSNGIPYGFKTFGDPREYELRDGRLFLFADQAERQLWSLDPTFNILKGEEVWRNIAKTPEMVANVRARIFKPSWHRSPQMMAQEWAYRNPGKALAEKPSTPAASRYALDGRRLAPEVARSATAPSLADPVQETPARR